MAKRTYRVLAADDEYWICENLKHIISWEEYGLEFLKPASDGEEVLARLEEEKPDILITDINMPFVDGLELLKTIHEKYPSIVTMVLSGYDDFQKVKGAFLEGSINYLLKPVNRSDLVNALARAIEMIGERDAVMLKAEKERTDAQKASSFLQDNEFSMMLMSGGIDNVPNILMPEDLAIGGVNMLLIKFHSISLLAEKYNHDMLYLSYSVKKKIKEKMNLEHMFIFNYSYRVNEFILCAELDEKQQRWAADQLLRLFDEKENGPVTIVLGEHTFMMENLKEAYHSAVAALMTRPFTPQSVVIGSSRSEDSEMQVLLSKEEEMKLSALISRSDRKGLEHFAFEEIGLMHAQEQKWSLLRTRQTVRKILNQIVFENSDRLTVRQSLNCEILIDRADQEVNQLCLQQVLDLMDEFFEEMTRETPEEMTESVRDSIRKAVRYVDQNFCENITLNELADMFHVEPTYFSRLFRQESGENLIPYVSRKRIEKAVNLMDKNELTLTEISFLIGYEDYGYFSRVFKKYMNCSPKDYRKNSAQESTDET